MTSCETDLIEKPLAVIDPSGYYKNYAEFQTALNGAYAYASNENAWGEDMFLIFNSGTDEVVMRNEVTEACYVGVYSVSPNNSAMYGDVYKTFYQAIGAANYILEALDGADLTTEERDIVEGQALFYRAWCHLQLSTLFGGIVIADKAQMPTSVPRSSIEEVFTGLIIPDMIKAKDLLPDTEYEPNRPNKPVVEAFLAWVYNYLGTAKVQGMGDILWAESPINSFEWVNASEYHAEALQYSTVVIQAIGSTLNKSLVSEYDYLFRFNTKETQQQEFLWTAPSTEFGEQLIHRMIQFGLPKGSRNRGGGQNKHRPTLEAYQRYDDRDIRKNHNIVFQQDPNASNIEIVNGLPYYGVKPAKSNGINSVGKYRYVDPAVTSLPNGAGLIDVAYMRLAEVYLIHAEALYFNGRETDARAALEPLRLRAAGNDVVVAADLTVAYYRQDFIQELLDERSREFFIEGKRRLDLFRFGYERYETAIYGIDQTASSQNSLMRFTTDNYNSKRIWGPISTTEIGVNSELQQNPGY